MGVLTLFFLLGFLALTLSESARLQFSPTIAFTLLDMSVGVIGVTWIFYAFSKKISLFPSYLLRPVLLVLLAMLVSLIFASSTLTPSQFFTSFLYIVRFFTYALLLGSVRYVIGHSHFPLQRMMILSGAGIVAIGILQFVFYKNLRNLFYLGWDDHLYRLFSTFFDPNFAGMFLVVYFLFLLGILWKQKIQITPQTISIVVITILTFLSIILTYSRSAYIMLIVGVIIFLVLNKQKKLALVGVAGIVVAIMLFSNTKIEGLNPLRTASSIARLDSIKNATTIISDHPLFGVGFNAYRYAQIRYGFRETVTPVPSHADAGTDNSFLFVLATMGIIGLGSYLYFLYSLFRPAYREKTAFSTAFVASGIAWCIGSFFINGLFYPAMMFWLFVFSAVNEESP